MKSIAADEWNKKKNAEMTCLLWPSTISVTVIQRANQEIPQSLRGHHGSRKLYRYRFPP